MSERVQLPPTKSKFGGLAWAALILGIVGVVGSILPFVNNLTAVAAVVGIILAIIALFGTKRIVAGIGAALGVLGIVFTVLMQQAFVDELNKSFDNVSPVVSESGVSVPASEDGRASEDVKLNGCSTKTEYGYTNVSADLDITNSTDSQASYWITVGVSDATGNRVSELFATVNSLQPGQTSKQSGQSAMTMLDGKVSGVQCAVVSVDRTAW